MSSNITNLLIQIQDRIINPDLNIDITDYHNVHKDITKINQMNKSELNIIHDEIYDLYYPKNNNNDTKPQISIDLVQKMVDREVELRLSETYLTKMKETESDFTSNRDWLDIVDLIQKQVVQEFGFDGNNLNYGLNILRSEVHNIPNKPFWITQNRASIGNLKVNDIAPNPIVHNLIYSDINSETTKIIDAKIFDPNDDKINFIFAGSIT